MPQTYGVISPHTMNPETVLQFTDIRKSIHTTLRKALPHRMGQNEPLPMADFLIGTSEPQNEPVMLSTKHTFYKFQQ